MLLTEGTKVRLTNTGDEGVIDSILDTEMVNVLLNNGMLIPAFIEDLERMEDTSLSNRPTVKAKFVTPKKTPLPPTPPHPETDSQYHILKSWGIQLAFDPNIQPDGTTSHYQIFLINDTPYHALFTFTLHLNGIPPHTLNGKIDSVSFVDLGKIKFTQLSDMPKVELDCWQVTTAGTGAKISTILKIKPKQFFKNTRTAPLLNRQVHWYQLFENFDKKEKTTTEDLKTYTKNNARKPKNQSSNYIHFTGSHPMELAHFTNEIDLHIENLVNTSRKMSNSEIMKIQLAHFDRFLEKALRVGVANVFIIHGVGKGRLRNEIATRLMNHPHVRTFKNEYHHKYGFGATEVFF